MSRSTTKAISAAVIVLLALLAWWFQQEGQESAERAADRPSATATAQGADEVGGDREEMPSRDEDGIPYVALDDLPAEAAETVALIDAGGPFPYPGKDGSTFGNFEGLLPEQPDGYYAEYTVDTPGLSHRGARRIVAGDGGELYWTEDHYESFERIWR
jgi:ribonuclease T1